MAKATISAPQTGRAEPVDAGGHAFPFESRGMTDADRSTHVWVGFNIPVCLYLDSESAGGCTVSSGTTLLDFKHVVRPSGRCGMPVQITGAEIKNDDRGNYTFTSVSACMPFRKDWIGRDYVAEAIRAMNETIIAYREVAGRPTIPTLGPTDLSQDFTIEGPFPDPLGFLNDSGLSGMYVSGERSDKTPMLSMKGFVGGWIKLKPVLGPDVFTELQEYLSGCKLVSAARRLLQEASRELKHGDHGFAAVLGGSALEVGIQELLDRKAWTSGTNGTFVNKSFVSPFVANGRPGFDTVNPVAFSAVEQLYKVRNKVAHEGKAYYQDDSYIPPRAMSVTGGDVETMLMAASQALAWIESQ